MFIDIIFLALRPPVEETISFLRSVLRTHGPDYLQIFLGPKAGNNLRQLGGVENLAIVLSGNDTLATDDFDEDVPLMQSPKQSMTWPSHCTFLGVIWRCSDLSSSG